MHPFLLDLSLISFDALGLYIAILLASFHSAKLHFAPTRSVQRLLPSDRLPSHKYGSRRAMDPSRYCAMHHFHPDLLSMAQRWARQLET